METGRGKGQGEKGKTGIAKGYLGTQDTWREREAMGKGQDPLLGGEVMESDFKRNGTKSVNANVQGVTGGLDDI